MRQRHSILSDLKVQGQPMLTLPDLEGNSHGVLRREPRDYRPVSIEEFEATMNSFTFRRIGGVDGWSAFEVWSGMTLVGYVTTRGDEWGWIRKDDTTLMEGEIRSSKRAVQWGCKNRDEAAGHLKGN